MGTIDFAYSRFCVGRFPGATIDQIVSLEKRIKVRFPDDYREFLLQFNGGHFSNPRIRVNMHSDVLEYLDYMYSVDSPSEAIRLGEESDLDLFDDNDPPEVVPIGRSLKNSLILLITHPEENGAIVLKVAFGGFVFLANGIQEFFGLLESDE